MRSRITVIGVLAAAAWALVATVYVLAVYLVRAITRPFRKATR